MAADSASAFKRTATGIELRLRLTPRADRDAVTGTRAVPEGLALEARVRAVPESGAANAAAAALIAKALGVPRSAVTLERGATSRVKTFHIEGAPEALAQRVAALIGEMA